MSFEDLVLGFRENSKRYGISVVHQDMDPADAFKVLLDPETEGYDEEYQDAESVQFFVLVMVSTDAATAVKRNHYFKAIDTGETFRVVRPIIRIPGNPVQHWLVRMSE